MDFQSILLFEPPAIDRLYPFSIMHIWQETRVGYFRLFEKMQNLLPDKRLIISAEKLRAESFWERIDAGDQSIVSESVLVFDASVLPRRELFDEMKAVYADRLSVGSAGKSAVFTDRGVPFAAIIDASDRLNPSEADRDFMPKILTDFPNLYDRLPVKTVERINFLYDAIRLNGEEIRNDFEFARRRFAGNNADFPGSFLVNRDMIAIDEGAVISPGCVLDASEGSIIIGKNARIMPGAVIIGPAVVGEDSTVKIGAKIYSDTTIGPVCKVGGEIENSIIHGRSNKQHDGFLGHSYLGEWVNLGADTNTSDLKNNYGNIRINLRGAELDTGRMFLGFLCGDHTKTGINTMLNTGTVAGLSCNIFTGDYPPKEIKSFSWGDKDVYELEKAVQTARVVMMRRNLSLGKAEEAVFRREYERTYTPVANSPVRACDVSDDSDDED